MAAPLLDLSERRNMDKNKALESALSQIERSFGKGSIMRLGQDNAVMEIESVSTGSIGLDIALGWKVGGAIARMWIIRPKIGALMTSPLTDS